MIYRQLKISVTTFLTAYLLLVSSVFYSFAIETVPINSTGKQNQLRTIVPKQSPPFLPVYRIKLRVHTADSSRAPVAFGPIFDEINSIWWSQAGICFEIHTVEHESPLNDGIDMWFSPYIGGFNGYYDGEQIQMTDNPVLGAAPNPAKFSAARTAAHELGHALNLHHRQDSDDNLMRSKTYGWQLSKKEIQAARKTAKTSAFADTTPLNCGPFRIN